MPASTCNAAPGQSARRWSVLHWLGRSFVFGQLHGDELAIHRIKFRSGKVNDLKLDASRENVIPKRQQQQLGIGREISSSVDEVHAQDARRNSGLPAILHRAKVQDYFGRCLQRSVLKANAHPTLHAATGVRVRASYRISESEDRSFLPALRCELFNQQCQLFLQNRFEPLLADGSLRMIERDFGKSRFPSAHGSHDRAASDLRPKKATNHFRSCADLSETANEGVIGTQTHHFLVRVQNIAFHISKPIMFKPAEDNSRTVCGGESAGTKKT
jgi:hypothetical protein